MSVKSEMGEAGLIMLAGESQIDISYNMKFPLNKLTHILLEFADRIHTNNNSSRSVSYLTKPYTGGHKSISVIGG